MRRRTNQNRHLNSILRSPVLFRQLLSPLQDAVRCAVSEEQERSWFPQLPVLGHLLAGIFFQVQQLHSLRDLIERLQIHIHKEAITGFAINRSTLSNANNSKRRLKVIRTVFATLVASAEGLPQRWRRCRKIAALDSTLLTCVPSAAWAEYRTKVRAGKGHLLYDLERAIPRQIIVSPGKVHDYRVFHRFLQVGWTYIVDRAYNAYDLFDYMTTTGIFFVCRLKRRSVYQITQKHRVKRAQRAGGVLHDRTVLLGTGQTQMQTPVRWVRFRTEDGKEYDFITNRFDLSPLTVAQLYQARWAIETFFKWLKRTLRLERSLGRSETGFEIHVLVTLIVDILLKLLAGIPPRANHVSVHVLRIISEYLFTPTSPALRRKLANATTQG
jgi:transposase